MRKRFGEKRFGAFTLVELLVVITIIGILMGLLLPTLSAVRETARRTQCANNLHQIGLGIQMMTDRFGHYPHAGWGPSCLGQPDLGFGLKQRGGFLYSILPFVDQQPLHDMPTSSRARLEMCRTPISYYNCPTRRPCQNFPSDTPIETYEGVDGNDNREILNGSFRGDYAMNSGTDEGKFADESFDGLYARGVLVQATEVTDGFANTLLTAEKYLDPNMYTNGGCWGDNEPAMSGDDHDQMRCAYSGSLRYIPKQDIPGYGANGYYAFGSAHTGSFNAVFCDTSTKRIRYGINYEVFSRIINRRDGKPVNFEEVSAD